MSLKLDMEKAYDKVEWSYLREVLEKLNMPSGWINTVMQFIESVSYSILVNEEQNRYLKPGRGLRQGDPLSPYLFLLVTEGLITSLEADVRTNTLKGIKVGKHCNPITNLLFAKDSLFFGQATVEEASILKRILSKYEASSGQHINLELQYPDLTASSSLNAMQQTLSYLWKMKLPPKTKHFLWRSLTDSLPTAVNLTKRKNIDPTCKICNGHREDIAHLFLSCPFVQEVNRQIGLSPELFDVSDLLEAFKIRRLGTPVDLFERWCIGLWEICHQRNNLLHGKELNQPKQVALFVEVFQHKRGMAKTILNSPPSLCV